MSDEQRRESFPPQYGVPNQNNTNNPQYDGQQAFPPPPSPAQVQHHQHIQPTFHIEVEKMLIYTRRLLYIIPVFKIFIRICVIGVGKYFAFTKEVSFQMG